MGYDIFKVKLKIYLYHYQNIPLNHLLSSKYLTNLERFSFNKYRNENVKKEKVVSSILKNKYIGDYYLNEHGKPLSNDKCFNISHSHDYIALVIDTVPVGIDIEMIRPVEEDLKNYISNEEENKYIHDDASFFEIWTNKEALVKANGNGINQKVNTIPGLPLNSIITYDNKSFLNKTIKYQNLIITISRQSIDDFEVEIIQEVL